MDMPPRDVLVPLLKLAGTAVVAAAAYRYGSKHVVAAARHKHGRPGAANVANKPSKHTTSDAKALDADAAQKQQQQGRHVAEHAAAIASVEAPAVPRSSLVVALLLQDGYMLVAVFGVLVMLVAVLTSLAVVALNDSVTSIDELQLFAPLMSVGMALVAVGMFSSMLWSPAKTRRPAATTGPTLQRCPFSGAVASMPVPLRTDVSDGDGNPEDDEDAAPRVSRCPFGFG